MFASLDSPLDLVLRGLTPSHRSRIDTASPHLGLHSHVGCPQPMSAHGRHRSRWLLGRGRLGSQQLRIHAHTVSHRHQTREIRQEHSLLDWLFHNPRSSHRWSAHFHSGRNLPTIPRAAQVFLVVTMFSRIVSNRLNIRTLLFLFYSTSYLYLHLLPIDYSIRRVIFF